MSVQRMRNSMQFGGGLTPLGKKLLIAYAAIYVVELICEHWLHLPVVRIFSLHPFGSPGWGPWQFLTHPFIQPPAAPLVFLLNCLIFYFFAQSVESVLGARRFLIYFYGSALCGALVGFAFSAVSGFSQPFFGMMPSLLALVVAFGLLYRDSTILLFFILPVRALYMSYGTAAITVLTFLAKVNPNGAYHLGGILFGWVFISRILGAGPRGSLRMAYLEWKLKRRRARFQVIDGNKDSDDPPTLH